MTRSACKFDIIVDRRLKDLLSRGVPKKGTVFVFNNLGTEFDAVAVSGLGDENAGFSEEEEMNEKKENIRIAAGLGARALQSEGIEHIYVENFDDTEAAAEGAALALWNDNCVAKEFCLELYETTDCSDTERKSWESGLLKADAQNLARELQQTPGNKVTPYQFIQIVLDLLCPYGVIVEGRNVEWLASNKFRATLNLTKQSCSQPAFLELTYAGTSPEKNPVVLIGKGMSFDGSSEVLKKYGEFQYRDMAGAAVIVAIMKALASLQVPINVTGLIPLCQNMATKIYADVFEVNCVTIRIQDTSFNSRILLADALQYSKKYNPLFVIVFSTLTDGIRKTLDCGAAAVFTNSKCLWGELNRAGAETGDRLWRFPFWEYYTRTIKHGSAADVYNAPTGRGGDLCTGAAFTREFAPKGDLIHMDISAVTTGSPSPYLMDNLMTGRPTRTVTQFLYQIACPFR